MPDLFDELAPKLLDVEGGYVNNPVDRGGPTNFRITQRVARTNGYNGDMKALTKERALGIYRALYWTKPGFSEVAARSELIGEEIFDAGVNVGVTRASEWLQRVLNVMNMGGTHYADIKVDGDIGPATLKALDAYLAKRGRVGETVMLRLLDALQGSHYLSLAERAGSQEAFMFGWARTRLGNVED